jgi:hypothetical protein
MCHHELVALRTLVDKLTAEFVVTFVHRWVFKTVEVCWCVYFLSVCVCDVLASLSRSYSETRHANAASVQIEMQANPLFNAPARPATADIANVQIEMPANPLNPTSMQVAADSIATPTDSSTTLLPAAGSSSAPVVNPVLPSEGAEAAGAAPVDVSRSETRHADTAIVQIEPMQASSSLNAQTETQPAMQQNEATEIVDVQIEMPTNPLNQVAADSIATPTDSSTTLLPAAGSSLAPVVNPVLPSEGAEATGAAPVDVAGTEPASTTTAAAAFVRALVQKKQ